MNIDEMQPGRELNILIAKKVMGKKRPSHAYSTDIAAAKQVVKKIKESYKVCFVLEDYQFDGKHWQAMFKGEFDSAAGKWARLDYAFADTPELAICRAALKVVNK